MILLRDTLSALMWAGGAILLVLVIHRLARRIVPDGLPEPDADGHVHPAVARDMATATGLRIAAFYGVILALVYAHELGQYQQVRDGLGLEAAAITDIYYDAGRYGQPLAEPVQQAMATYVRFVVDREWALLAEDMRLSRRAWAARDMAYDAVLDAVPTNGRQEALRGHMLARLADVTVYRHQRQEVAAKDFGLVFWVPAVVGLVLVAVPFHVYPPARGTDLMLASFGAFSGLILFFIQAFATPFEPPVQIAPGAFIRLLETDLGATPTLPPEEIERRAARYVWKAR